MTGMHRHITDDLPRISLTRSPGGLETHGFARFHRNCMSEFMGLLTGEDERIRIDFEWPRKTSSQKCDAHSIKGVNIPKLLHRGVLWWCFFFLSGQQKNCLKKC